MTSIWTREVDGKVVEILGAAQPGVKARDENDPLVKAFRNPPPTGFAIGRERDRRLGLGFDYDFGDERGVHHFATTEEDMKGWDRVTKLKDALLQSGDQSTKIKISTATGRVEVTAPEWVEILLYAAANFEQPLWQASFDLQDMNPIPTDYATNPAYWPA
ncbi:hypothetical protein [Rhizobium sp. SU303]|uniref:hypothetical protein n=1 Tax=Rhizobium sp. SU303 TaxID=3138065 RepID=UPI001E33368E|nr:hypothetical protein [Rhizobium leguminosarum]UFW80027.1 hypothetical protein RlegSU303_08945 [Rhizobium leguminosarum bv. viciae]